MTDLSPEGAAPADDELLDDILGEDGGAPEPELDEFGEPIEADEDDELDDYEDGGKTYKVPKALVGRLMKDADYTQKTQALAAERQEVETGRQSVIEQATLHRAMLSDVAKVVSLNEQLSAYEAITPEQWEAAQRDDPDQVSAARLKMQLLREARDRAAGDLQKKERDRLDASQREAAKAVEQRDAVLARDIKGWTKDSLGKLAESAKSFGFTKAEVEGTTDPRAIKVLRAAVIGLKAQGQTAKAQDIERQVAVAPARRISGGSAPRTGLSDKLSPEEWDRRREAQVAARRKAQGR